MDADPAFPAVAGEEHRDELRLAVVLNGGVSLAVWMGGVAQELDALRRAAGPPGAGPRTTRTDALYGRLLGALGARARVDVVAGASAGGINGALLAAVAANGGRLDRGRGDGDGSPAAMSEIKRVWMEDGSFDALIRDPDEPAPEGRPPSLLRGDEHLGARLREVLEGLMDGEGAGGGPGEPVSLLLTGTDARGLRRAVDERVPYEEHRLLFRFRHPPGDRGGRAGLRTENVAQLAAAARATASFPGAFEPARVSRDDLDDGLVGRDGRFDDPSAGRNPRLRWAIDGGVLDNAPFGPLVEEMERTRGTEVGERVLVYVTPHHAAPPAPGAVNPRPGLLETVARGMGLPRRLTAMNDLPRVGDYRARREQAFEAIRDLLASASDADLRAAASRLIPAYRAFRLRAVFGDEVARAPAPGNWLPEGPAALDASPADWRFGHAPARRAAAFALAGLSRARRALERRWSESAPGWAGRVRALRGAEARVDTVLMMLAAWEERRLADLPPAGTRARREWLAADWPGRERARRGAAALRCARELVRCREEVREAVGWDPGGDPRALLARLLAAEVVLGAGATRPGIGESTPAVDLRLEVIDPREPEGGVDDSGRPVASAAARDPRRKLAGVSLSHFGGFANRAWRENDWRWGRLDGARRITEIVLTRRRLRLAADGPAALNALAGALAALVLDGLDEEALADPGLRASLRAALGGDDLPAGAAALREEVRARMRTRIADAREDGGDEALERLRRAIAWRLWAQVLEEELPGDGGIPAALARFGAMPSPAPDGALYDDRMPFVVASAARLGVRAAAPAGGPVARRLAGAALRGAAWLWFTVAAAAAGPGPAAPAAAVVRDRRRLALGALALLLLGAAQGAMLLPGRWSGVAGQVLAALTVTGAGFLLGVMARAARGSPRALALVAVWLAGGVWAWALIGSATPPGPFEWALAAAALLLAAGLVGALALRLRRARAATRRPGSRPSSR